MVEPCGLAGAAAVSGMYAAGASMIWAEWRRCWHRKGTPTAASTDNGKQNTYFSSLDNMVAGAMFCLFCTVKCAWGPRVVSQEISTADEGDGGQVVVIGR